MNEQIERNRMELVLALRSGRYTQLREIRSNGQHNHFCFAGLAGQIIIGDHNSVSSGFCDKIQLSVRQVWDLAMLNNSGKTFPELADILVKDYGFPDVHIEEPQVELELQEVAA